MPATATVSGFFRIYNHVADFTCTANGGESVPLDITQSLTAKLKEKGIDKSEVLGAGVGHAVVFFFSVPFLQTDY